MRLAVNVPEAAELIGISESMLWQLLTDGDIAKVKIGRRTLIRVAELERFLAAGEDSIPDGEPVVHSMGRGRGRRPAGGDETPSENGPTQVLPGRNRDAR